MRWSHLFSSTIQNQATDRAHRLGQTKTVTVYKLIMKDSIEEKILKLQEAKKDLANEILKGETGNLGSLSQEELRIFPDELYDQNHQPHSPASVVYSPKELMEMDWLDECVEGALPHYDDLDVKTRTLMAINGLDNLKGLEK